MFCDVFHITKNLSRDPLQYFIIICKVYSWFPNRSIALRIWVMIPVATSWAERSRLQVEVD